MTYAERIATKFQGQLGFDLEGGDGDEDFAVLTRLVAAVVEDCANVAAFTPGNTASENACVMEVAARIRALATPDAPPSMYALPPDAGFERFAADRVLSPEEQARVYAWLKSRYPGVLP